MITEEQTGRRNRREWLRPFIQLILAFGATFSIATPADDTEIYFAGAGSEGAPNILFILDASRSMLWGPADQIPANLSVPPYSANDPRSRFSIMKNALLGAIENLRGANVGLIDYGGHGEEAMANGVKYPVTPVTVESINAMEQRINGFKVDGFTPIVQSLYESARYFRGEGVDYGVSPNPQRAADPATYVRTPLAETETLQGHFSAYCSTTPDLGQLERDLQTRTPDYVPGSLANLRCNDTTSGTCTEYKESGECANFQSSGKINGGFWTYDYQVRKWRGVYISPIDNECQENVVVLLSDGKPDDGLGSLREPQSDLDIQNKVQSLIGGSCSTPAAGLEDGRCGPELTHFLANTDQDIHHDGEQTIHTYVVGFAIDGEGKRYLSSLAQPHPGNQGFYTADDEAALTQALTNITSDLVNINSSFSPPTLSIDQTTGLDNGKDIFVPMFRASKLPRWVGNLKRYQLDASVNPPTVRDSTGQVILDGAGRIINSARSFWLPEEDDPDGADVGSGGAARLLGLDRNLFTNTEQDILIPLTVDNLIDQNWLDPAVPGGDTAPALTDEEKTRLVNYIRGIDPVTGNTPRHAMGDILHSRPEVVDFGSPVGDTRDKSGLAKQVLFVGSNEGYLHAIRASDGQELFAFMPRALLKNVKTLYDNLSPLGTITHPYGMDGPITIWRNDVDQDGRIDPGMSPDKDRNGDGVTDYRDRDFVWLFAGMRRGGRAYYALDVTDPTAPALKWVVRGGAGDYAKLGQSWAKPVVTQVELDGKARHVLIVGGGYDTHQDQLSGEGRAPDTVGNAIFFIDPNTGERLWMASNEGGDLNITSMRNSFPGGTRVLDIDNNGIADRIYAADVGGRIFRIDLPDSQNKRVNQAALKSNGGTAHAKIRLFADLSVDGDVREFRRFYHEPDVSIVNAGGKRFITVAIGSGYRAHPLLKQNATAQDRLYVLRDRDVFTVPSADRATLHNDDLTELQNARTAIGQNGWYLDLNRAGGEKALARAVTFNNTVFFTTFEPETTPPANVCSTASHTGRVYAWNITNGRPAINFREPGKTPQTLGDGVLAYGTPDIPSEVYFNLSSDDAHAPVVDAFIGAHFEKLLSRTQLEALRKVYWQEQINGRTTSKEQ